MKKALGLLLGALLVLSFLLVPSFVLAKTEEKVEGQNVNSFEMFWPIVAGKTEGDSMYWLKSLKEKLREMMIYSKYGRADYNIMIAEKRAVEFEKLLTEKKDLVNAAKTLEASKVAREKVLTLIKGSTDEGRDTSALKDRFLASLDKQKKLFMAWESKTEEKEVKDLLKSFLDSIKSNTSALQ